MNKYGFTFLIIMILLSACTNNMTTLNDSVVQKIYNKVREPAVAGQFYSEKAKQLTEEVEKYLDEAGDVSGVDPATVRAIMVPHAGHVFSGLVAAYGYKQLAGRKIGTAVIICNSHTTRFSGIAIDDSDAWRTPIGTVEVDHELGAKLVGADKAIKYNGRAHETDHTLEVQVPFLQTVIQGDFKVLPILFGNTDDAAYEKLAALLHENLNDNDIVIISTDMSHYPGYSDANRIDKGTLGVIKSLDVEKLDEYIKKIDEERILNEQTVICGVDGVKAAMTLAGLSGWDQAEVLKYSNSGETPLIGDKSRVVGYGAMAFIKSDSGQAGESSVLSDNNILNKEQKKVLLNIARRTVETYVKTGQKADFKINDERLNWQEGAFVTLSVGGELRGCIGQIIPSTKPLWKVIRDMGISACSEDNRFSPVGEKELLGLEYEISVLSAPEAIEDWQEIEMGKHGVIVKKGPFNAGVFLPQVAEHFNNNREMFFAG